MAAIKLITKPTLICDWCARESKEPLVAVTIVTPRGAFRDEICTPCYNAFENSQPPAV